MVNRLPLCFCFCLLAGAAQSQEVAEWKKLEGTWKIVILDSDGERFKGGFGSFDCIVIEKRKLVVKGAERTQEWGTLTIDPSTSPKLMDLKEAAAAAKGNTAEGIYQLEGERLQICLGRNIRSCLIRLAEVSGPMEYL
jgi:uncharacterized protein (TIGR03067 family)